LREKLLTRAWVNKNKENWEKWGPKEVSRQFGIKKKVSESKAQGKMDMTQKEKSEGWDKKCHLKI